MAALSRGREGATVGKCACRWQVFECLPHLTKSSRFREFRQMRDEGRLAAFLAARPWVEAFPEGRSRCRPSDVSLRFSASRWMCSYSSSISGVTDARVSPSAASKSAMVTLADIEPPAKRGEAGTPHEVLEVGAGEALGAPGERFEIDVGGKRHAPWCGSRGSAAGRPYRECRRRSARRSGPDEAAPGRSGSAGWWRRSRPRSAIPRARPSRPEWC